MVIWVTTDMTENCRNDLNFKDENNAEKLYFSFTTGLLITSLENNPVIKTLIPKKVPKDKLMT